MLCPSDDLAYHPCGLKHGMVDSIDCFDVVVVWRVTHQVGIHLVDEDDAANTRHRSIRNALLALPVCCQVVGSTRRTRMSWKKIVGCGGRRDSCTTTGRSPCSNARDIERTEERSVHSIGHVGGGGAIDLGDSWASGQVGGIVFTAGW
jgi:hypothetical protein